MTKLYQVVNDQDEIIGYKNREDIDAKKDIYRIAALWLTNSESKVLIAQRVLTKDKDPGKWGPAAAGTLEKDETYESNIYKEAEEEIGLTDVTFTPGPKQRFYEPRHAFCQWFVGVCDKDSKEFKLQEEEVEQVSWVDYGELAKDVKSNPEKYTPSMPLILTIFAKSTNF
jgi:isopentenyl-diphosphate delta-isomerase